MLKMGITIIKPDYNENFITLRKEGFYAKYFLSHLLYTND